MNAPVQTPARKPESKFAIVVQELKRYDTQIASILPKHIPAERFQRVLIGAMSGNPKVVQAAAKDPRAKQSLIREVMKAANDGIILDGREGALTTRRRKVRGANGQDEYFEDVSYMPMAQGVLKRMRNSGEISTIECDVVYQNDYFKIKKGDDSFLDHVPWYCREDVPEGTFTEPGALKFAYLSVKLKDGSRMREVMTKFDIAKIKAASPSKDKKGNPVGPWADWEEEMWRKSVLHRGAKWLPKSSDKETGESVTTLLDRDAAFLDVNAEEDDRGEIDASGNSEAIDGEIVDPETGEVKPTQKAEPKKPAETKKPVEAKQSAKPAATKQQSTPAKGAAAALDDPDEDAPDSGGSEDPEDAGDGSGDLI